MKRHQQVFQKLNISIDRLYSIESSRIYFWDTGRQTLLHTTTLHRMSEILWIETSISVFQYFTNSFPTSIHASGSAFLQEGIHDSTLTQSEIKEIYNNFLNGKCIKEN